MTKTLFPVILAAMLAGCAAFQNTPQQDRVYDAWHMCEYEGRIPGNIQLIRVMPDGRYWYQWTSSAYGYDGVRDCIREHYRSAK